MADLASTARVTPTDLEEVIGTTYGVAILNAFINMAHRMVEDNLLGKGLSADALYQIELNLAAHALAMRQRQAMRKAVGDGEYEVVYTGTFGAGLESTQYGQMALLMDTTSSLASLGQKRINLIIFDTPEITETFNND